MAVTAITATSTDPGRKEPRQFQDLFDVIPFVVTIEDDTVAAGLASVADVTVPGAALGDIVLIAAPVDYVAATLTAFVQSANTVTIKWQNDDDGAANTALATPVQAKGIVLKPKGNWEKE